MTSAGVNTQAHFKQIDSRVIIDPDGYANEHGWFKKSIVSSTLSSHLGSHIPRAGRLHGDIGILDVDSLSTEELMTFPSRIGGYSLLTKDAGFFRVDRLTDVVWEDDQAEEFRKSSHRMRSILRVASGFSSSSSTFNYSIKDKGRGFVCLLYGPPGTGKTLTAGTLSESEILRMYLSVS
jgi:Cdc6-like AAA superfamily ATPase